MDIAERARELATPLIDSGQSAYVQQLACVAIEVASEIANLRKALAASVAEVSAKHYEAEERVKHQEEMLAAAGEQLRDFRARLNTLSGIDCPDSSEAMEEVEKAFTKAEERARVAEAKNAHVSDLLGECDCYFCTIKLLERSEEQYSLAVAEAVAAKILLQEYCDGCPARACGQMEDNCLPCPVRKIIPRRPLRGGAMVDLTEIQKRCDAATKGVWMRVPQTRGGDLIAREYETGEQMSPKGLRLIASMMTRGNSLVEDEANADFIAHSRQDIPALLSEVSALRERVEELEGVLQETRQALNAAFFDGKAYAGNETMQRALLDVIEKNKKALAPRGAKEE